MIFDPLSVFLGPGLILLWPRAEFALFWRWRPGQTDWTLLHVGHGQIRLVNDMGSSSFCNSFCPRDCCWEARYFTIICFSAHPEVAVPLYCLKNELMNWLQLGLRALLTVRVGTWHDGRGNGQRGRNRWIVNLFAYGAMSYFGEGASVNATIVVECPASFGCRSKFVLNAMLEPQRLAQIGRVVKCGWLLKF